MKPSTAPSMACFRELENITLHPHLTAGIRMHNKKTGETGNQSVTFSGGISLLNALLAAGAFLAALHLLFCLCRMKKEYKMRKKYRNKIRRLREKMSKS